MKKKIQTLFLITTVTFLSCSHPKYKALELFGKNKNELIKTSEMLDEDEFWKIIDKSLKNSKNGKEQEQFLVKELEKLTPKKIIGFFLRTIKLHDDIYTSEMWCAGSIMNNGGCSEDCFFYFRFWVISLGKKDYYQAKDNSDSLENKVVAEFINCNFGFNCCSVAFENKTGKNIDDYADYNNVNEWNQMQEVEPNWTRDEPETMKKICPKLFKKLWKD